MKTIKLDKYSFKFEDIDLVYPIYSFSIKTQSYYNFRKSVSAGAHSREYQLNHRSIQAIKFDTLVDADYFKDKCQVEIIKEFPLINTRFDIDNKRSYYLLDYFIPSKSLCIELDSCYHDDRPDSDKRKDEFLKSLGIEVLRVRDFNVSMKFKLDKIIEWINKSNGNEFNLTYYNLIDSYTEYKDKLRDESKSGPLGDVRPKWRKVIELLCSHYTELNTAIETRSEYVLNVHLDDLYKLHPLKDKQIRSYRHLADQLLLLGIELNIKSDWSKKNKLYSA